MLNSKRDRDDENGADAFGLVKIMWDTGLATPPQEAARINTVRAHYILATRSLTSNAKRNRKYGIFGVPEK